MHVLKLKSGSIINNAFLKNNSEVIIMIYWLAKKALFQTLLKINWLLSGSVPKQKNWKRIS